jgi:hypothetical protein
MKVNLSYLVDGAKAAFSKLVPCGKIVRGESYGCHVKQRDVKVFVLTGFIFQLPVLDRSKWDTGAKRVEPLRALKPPWIAQGKFSFHTPGLAHGFAETTAYISPVRNGRDLGLTPLFLKSLFQMKNPPNPKRTRTNKLTKTTTTMFFFLEPSPLEAVGIIMEKVSKGILN